MSYLTIGRGNRRLAGVKRTLRDAQYEILTFVGVDTYLVGHSLESDLRALKMVHQRLIDTSELYPSARGAPFKVERPTVASELVIVRPTLGSLYPVLSLRHGKCLLLLSCGWVFPRGFSHVHMRGAFCGQISLKTVTKLITVV